MRDQDAIDRLRRGDAAPCSSRRTISSRVRSTELATSRSASSRSVVRFSSVKKLASAACDLLRPVDLAFAQPLAKILGRDVEIHDLVGGGDDPVGHGFAHRDAERRRDDVVQRFEMLHVDGGDDVDAVVEQLASRPPSACGARRPGRWCARARRRSRPAGARAMTRVDVHLLERDAAILDAPSRHDLEVADLCLGLGAPVRLDESDDDVDARARRRSWASLSMRYVLPTPGGEPMYTLSFPRSRCSSARKSEDLRGTLALGLVTSSDASQQREVQPRLRLAEIRARSRARPIRAHRCCRPPA